MLKNILYACNDNYIKQTIISAESLLRYNNPLIKIWVVSDNISPENRMDLEKQVIKHGAIIEFVDIEYILRDILIFEGNRHPRTIYAKLFLEDIIDADKLLYLDSDTIVTASLNLLWQREMEGELVAGVQMPYSLKIKEQVNIRNDNPYICDGVVMLNLKMWRKEHVGNECREYIRGYRGMPPMQSEGTLNYICQERIGVLGPEFNLMPSMIMYSSDQIKRLFKVCNYYSEIELRNAKKKPVVIHFINELFNRPWLEPCDHPYKKKYVEIETQIFGYTTHKCSNIRIMTRLTKLLFKIFPFGLFSKLYHIKNRNI